MTYLFTALDAEARPLIEHYRLKRCYDLPYTLYTGDNIILCVSGIGPENAMMAVSAVLGYRIPQTHDTMINIGICAAPATYPVGTGIIIHQIQTPRQTYYPDILFSHPFCESSIVCSDQAADSAHPYPLDMESSGVFRAASRFFKLHRIVVFKIVSDHFHPDQVTKEGVIDLVSHHCASIDFLIEALDSVPDSPKLFDLEESSRIERLKEFFTVSQGIKLDEAFCYFRLKHPQKPLPFSDDTLPHSKRERSLAYERLIATLTA